jgi:hypothetical protein
VISNELHSPLVKDHPSLSTIIEKIGDMPYFGEKLNQQERENFLYLNHSPATPGKYTGK